MTSAPKVDAIRKLRNRLGNRIQVTPMLRCAGLEDLPGMPGQLFGKLEFLQQTGTFKARGALAQAIQLDDAARKAGITAVSAGNHAVAAAFAAQAVGTSAKIVMTRSANPARVAACRAYGADIVVSETVHDAFELAETIQREEGRYLVHPYDGPLVSTGTGLVGLEIHEQCPDAQVVLVSVGGGGLIGGIANALKQLRPDCRIIGVEPEGADSMHRSFEAGEPRSIESVKTIADSLGAPYATPFTYEVCRRNVDEIILVNDEQIRRAMGLLFGRMKIAVEPACATTTAALLGPLREQLTDQKVVNVFCGSNIDWPTFAEQAIFEDDDADQ